MTENTTEMLGRFIDGELSPDEAAAFEKQLADDAELAADQHDFMALGALLRSESEPVVEAADFSGFFAGIESQLGDVAAAPAEAAPIAARAAPAEPEAEGLISRFTNWLTGNWMPLAVGAAAAAAIAFWATRPATPVGPDQPAVAGTVVVDAVSNDGNKTVLISQPAPDEEGATVIWLLEDEDEDQPETGEDPI